MADKVYIARCADYKKMNADKAVREVLSEFGGASAMCCGKHVLIKVNLLMASVPDKAVTTHPSIISAIAREFIEAGNTVEIADSCGGVYTETVLEKLYAVSGMKKVAEETGAILNYDTSSFEKNFDEGVRIRKFNVISPVKRADFIISAAKMKTHGFTYYTGAVKNMFGVIPGLTKAAMHSRFPDKKAFCEMLVDLCESISPDFSIIDGVYGMEGAGPSGGVPKYAGVVIASENPYAADIAAMKIMGLSVENSYVHTASIGRGLVSDIDFCGVPVSEVATKFEPAYKREPRTFLSILPGAARVYAERFFAAYPSIIRDKCVGCGECARSCPESTITICDGKATINYKKCIRCYCCQEMCKLLAVKIERFVKYKKR